jgi:ABC-2 type transport system permease protein
MNATVSTIARVPPFAPLRCYWLEAKHELLRLLRTPSFVLPTLLFPPLFYVLFGVLLGGKGGGEAARYMLATYGVFGIMGAALFGFGVTVAVERERGFLALKRALPMPPGAYLLAKMAMAMVFAAIISLVLALLAVTVAKVSLQPGQWALLFRSTCSACCHSAIGMYIGSLVGGSAAPAVVNLLYLPMSFLSGLWLPLAMLPAVFARIAPVWPSYHLGQVALKVVGRDAGGSLAMHLGLLAVMTLTLFVLARARLAPASADCAERAEVPTITDHDEDVAIAPIEAAAGCSRLVPDELQLGWMPVFNLSYLVFLFLPLIFTGRRAARRSRYPARTDVADAAVGRDIPAAVLRRYRASGPRLVACMLGIAALGYRCCR